MEKKTTTKKAASKSTAKKSKSKKSKSNKQRTLLYILVAIFLILALVYFYKNPGEFNRLMDYVLGPEEQTVENTVTNTAKSDEKPAVVIKAENAQGNGEENSSLYFGNPTGAVKDVNVRTNYLIEHPQFTMSYNADKYIPNWVSWHLDLGDIGESERADNFRPDETLPEGWYGVKKADYQYTKYGFDRGHVCPSADRTSSDENNSMTFLMTNMIPQSPDCNRVIWKDFEAFERDFAKNGKEVYIIAGPDGIGGTSGTGTWDYIEMKNGGKIEVPAYCWKVLLILDAGDDDINRVTTETEVIALYMPNAMGMGKTGSWEQYLCSVDYIEEKTGYDFLAPIPDEIEDILEAKVYSGAKK